MFVFLLLFLWPYSLGVEPYSLGVEPDVTHGTSWLKSTEGSGVPQHQAGESSIKGRA